MQAEGARRRAAIAVVLRERRLELLARDVARPVRRGRRDARATDLRIEVLRTHDPIVTGALRRCTDRGTQLAYVARPHPEQALLDQPRVWHRIAELVSDQPRNLGATIADRRQLHLRARDPVVEVG